jgi:hypothetical protein
MRDDKKAEGTDFVEDLDPRAREINARYDQWERNQNAAVADAIAIGHLLLAVKDAVGHGHFLDWLKKTCKRISSRRAEEWMRFAYRLDAMTDLLPKVAGKTFQAAEKIVDGEWKARGMKAFNSVTACEREIKQAHSMIHRAVTALYEMLTRRRIDDGVEVVDDSALQAWFKLYDLTPEIVAGWTKETHAMMENNFGVRRTSAGDFSKPVPASMFPDPQRRRDEEAAMAEAEGLDQVVVEAKTEDMTAAEQFAAGRLKPSPRFSDGEDEPA